MFLSYDTNHLHIEHPSGPITMPLQDLEARRTYTNVVILLLLALPEQ